LACKCGAAGRTCVHRTRHRRARELMPRLPYARISPRFDRHSGSSHRRSVARPLQTGKGNLGRTSRSSVHLPMDASVSETEGGRKDEGASCTTHHRSVVSRSLGHAGGDPRASSCLPKLRLGGPRNRLNPDRVAAIRQLHAADVGVPIRTPTGRVRRTGR
jgi:hypothetical protein